MSQNKIYQTIYWKTVPFFVATHGIIGGTVGWNIELDSDPSEKFRVFRSLVGLSMGITSGIVFPITYGIFYGRFLMFVANRRIQINKK
jgi:hypothetical protein